MTPTIKSFTCTSTLPYDRHTYKLYLTDGRTTTFHDYEQLRAYWMQTNQIMGLSHVEVLDTKGFK